MKHCLKWVLLFLPVWVFGQVPDNTFWPNGNKKDQYIITARQDLIIHSYDSAGNILATVQYRNGKEHGTWKTYYPGSKLKTSYKYYYGRLNGKSYSYYPNGILKDCTPYFMGNRKGKYREYYESGRIKKEVHYKLAYYLKDRILTPLPPDHEKPAIPSRMSVQVGKEKIYYENGRLQQIGYYDYYYIMEYDLLPVERSDGTVMVRVLGKVMPVKTGKWEYFYENGKVARFEIYDKDELKETINF